MQLRAVLEFAARGDQFVLVLADQAIARDGLEVAHVADGADVPPRPFHAEEPFEQELVGDIREEPADVDGGERGFDPATERESQDRPAVTEVATGVAVRPGGLEQQFLQTNPAPESSRGQVERLLVIGFLDVGRLGGQQAGRFENVAVDRVVGSVNRRCRRARRPQHFKFGALSIPAIADRTSFQGRVLAGTDAADCGDSLDFGGGLGTHVLNRIRRIRIGRRRRRSKRIGWGFSLC